MIKITLPRSQTINLLTESAFLEARDIFNCYMGNEAMRRYLVNYNYCYHTQVVLIDCINSVFKNYFLSQVIFK